MRYGKRNACIRFWIENCGKQGCMRTINNELCPGFDLSKFQAKYDISQLVHINMIDGNILLDGKLWKEEPRCWYNSSDHSQVHG